MRQIDADALVKETTEARCVNCDRRKGMKKGKMTFVYEIGEVPCRACDVMDMIEALEEAPTVAAWISVKERLPEKHGPYLCYLGHYPFGPSLEIVNYNDKKGSFWWFEGNVKAPYVTHWMPLPEQPEEDDLK